MRWRGWAYEPGVSAVLEQCRAGEPTHRYFMHRDCQPLGARVRAQRDRRGGGAEIWKYGPLQPTIANDKLEALKLDCLERNPLPTPLQHVEVLPTETPLYAFIDMLDDHGIDWEIDPAYSFDRQLCIRTERRVRAYFDLDHRELQSIQVIASE
jgi:hypothetical protein